jgi:hypothetical protein
VIAEVDERRLHPPAARTGSKGLGREVERVAPIRKNGDGRRPEPNAKAGGDGEKRAPEAKRRRQSRLEVAGGFVLVAAQATRVRDALVDGRHPEPRKLSPLTRWRERRFWRGDDRKAVAVRQECQRDCPLSRIPA